jgi:hypothetical protein
VQDQHRAHGVFGAAAADRAEEQAGETAVAGAAHHEHPSAHARLDGGNVMDDDGGRSR